MNNNIKASEQVAVLALVAPSSQAIGSSVSGWISAANFQKYLAKIQAGVLGAGGTINASFQQAQDGAGTSAKAVGVAIAPIIVNNQCALLELDAQQLDVEGGFGFIQLTVAVGVAASQTSATLFGFNPRYAPASAYNAASVVQVVG